MAHTESDTETISCPACPSGFLEEGTTELTFSERLTPVRPIIVVTNVPAEVCDVCGEATVDSESASEVEKLLQEVGFWWNRDPSRLEKDEDVVIGGELGGTNAIIRLDFRDNDFPYARSNTVRDEDGSEE